MKISYKKKHLNINLILGLVWLVWFFVGVFVNEEPNWTDYGWLIISLSYLGLYFYQKHYTYLTIENGMININGPFGKKLNMNDLKQIKKFAGDYILKTDQKELTINTQIIDPNSLAQLDAELKKTNVAWD